MSSCIPRRSVPLGATCICTGRGASWAVVCFALWASGCSGDRSQNAVDAPVASSEGERCLQDAAASRTVPEDAPERIAVSHLLLRHAELSEPKGAERTRQAACLLALEALRALQSGADWEETVQKYSDSGKDTGGDLGRVARDELTGPIANAAFSLEVNELSYVVESDRGYHIVLRTQ